MVVTITWNQRLPFSLPPFCPPPAPTSHRKEALVASEAMEVPEEVQPS